KHKTTGHDHQFVTNLDGRLVHVSEPLPGRTHDAKAVAESGLLAALDPANMMGDKGYIANQNAHALPQTGWQSAPPRAGRVQHLHQRAPVCDRTRHRQLHSMALHAHRLPPAAGAPASPPSTLFEPCTSSRWTGRVVQKSLGASWTHRRPATMRADMRSRTTLGGLG
ncbi:MAG: transposase family protein, partial [Actinomycetes bacterium]